MEPCGCRPSEAVDPLGRLLDIPSVTRPFAYAVSAAALAAMLYPALLDPQDPRQDSFPLSTYPMFSYRKPRTATVTSALAIDPTGAEQPVPPDLVATSETMQAFRTLRKS